MTNTKRCGAKARTRGGAPCMGPSMPNGRCRMHNGGASKRIIHGRATRRVKLQRSKESAFLKEMRDVNYALENLIRNGQNETD